MFPACQGVLRGTLQQNLKQRTPDYSIIPPYHTNQHGKSFKVIDFASKHLLEYYNMRMRMLDEFRGHIKSSPRFREYLGVLYNTPTSTELVIIRTSHPIIAINMKKASESMIYANTH